MFLSLQKVVHVICDIPSAQEKFISRSEILNHTFKIVYKKK